MREWPRGRQILGQARLPWRWRAHRFVGPGHWQPRSRPCLSVPVLVALWLQPPRPPFPCAIHDELISRGALAWYTAILLVFQTPVPTAAPTSRQLPAAQTPLEALLSSSAAWHEQPELCAAMCRAIESGQWDADIARASATAGPGLVERLVLSPAEQGRRHVRQVVLALLDRGAPTPRAQVVRQAGLADPMMAALLACREKDPAMMADSPKAEDLWAACQGPKAGLKTVCDLLEKNGWRWDTLLMGSRILDLVLAMAQGWLPTPRDPADGPKTTRTKRQKDWLFLARKVEPGHSTPLSKALLWACSPLVVQDSIGHGSCTSTESDIPMVADDLVPPRAMAATLETLSNQESPFIRAWLAPVLPGLLACPFTVHQIARHARAEEESKRVRATMVEAAAQAGKPLTRAQQKEVSEAKFKLPPSPVEHDYDLPPGLSSHEAWELMIKALSAGSPRTPPLPTVPARLFLGVCNPSPADALRRLNALAGPCPDEILQAMEPATALGWQAMLCAGMVSGRPLEVPGEEFLPLAASRLKAMAVSMEGGDPGRGEKRALDELSVALKDLDIFLLRSLGVFSTDYASNRESSPAMRSLMLELSLPGPSWKAAPGRSMRL